MSITMDVKPTKLARNPFVKRGSKLWYASQSRKVSMKWDAIEGYDVEAPVARLGIVADFIVFIPRRPQSG